MTERPTFVGADYGEQQSAEVFFRVNSDGSVTIIDVQQWTATIDVEPETQKAPASPDEGTGGQKVVSGADVGTMSRTGVR